MSEQIIWNKEEIQKAIAKLAERINQTFTSDRLLCLVVLRGGFFFAADLIRQLKGFEHIKIDFLRITSYQGSQSSGKIQFHGDMPRVAGYDVLVIEDLLDTGLTLATVSDALKAGGAASVRYAVLVDKRNDSECSLEPDFAALRCSESKYLYGYGMDMNEIKRELPYIAFDNSQEKGS